MDNRKGQPLLIIALAVAVLIGLSLCPWSKWTGGTIKDFNLLNLSLTTRSKPISHAGLLFEKKRLRIVYPFIIDIKAEIRCS